MELHLIEVKKALATEAFSGGDYDEAESLYRELHNEYLAHGMHEGCLAITFNRLLVALEQGSRRRSLELIGSLAHLLAETRDVGAVTDVAQRVCCLFSDPVPGVDHESTAALVALASDLANHQSFEPEKRIDVASLPEPNHFLGRPVLETALHVLSLAHETEGNASVPAWLRSVQGIVYGEKSLDDTFATAYQQYLYALQEGDTLRAYRSLVDAQWHASQADLFVAFQLSVGLSQLERPGLPKKLQFAPNPPEERRFVLECELFARLADGLATVPDGWALAQRLSIGILDAGYQVIDKLAARHGRGGRRAQDDGTLGRIRTLMARALRRLGRVDEALLVLEPSFISAERGGLDGVGTRIGVLLEMADLQCRSGDPGQAFLRYTEAFRAAVPSFVTARSDLQRSEAVHEISSDGNRLLWAVEAMAGAARTSEGPQASQFVAWGRLLVDVAGPNLRGDMLATAQSDIELVAARLGEPGSALRSLEAARVLNKRDTAALSFIYWARRSMADETPDLEQVVSLCADAAREARTLVTNSLKLSIDLSIADVLQAVHSAEAETRYEMLIRRIAENLPDCKSWTREWALESHIVLDVTSCLQSHVQHLITTGKIDLARKLCTGWRLSCWSEHSPNSDEPELPVTAWLDSEYRVAWLEQRRSGFSDWPAFDAPKSKNHTPLHTTRGASAWAEVTLFRDWGVVFRGQRRSVECLTLEFGLSAFSGDRSVPEESSLAAHQHTLTAALVAGEEADALPIVSCQPEVAHALMPQSQAMDDPRHILPIISIPVLNQSHRASDGESDKRLAIVGDDATVRDLSLSTLAQPNIYNTVFTRSGDALSPHVLAETLTHAGLMCFVGEVDSDGALHLRENGHPYPSQLIGRYLGGAALRIVSIMGPVDKFALKPIMRSLIPNIGLGLLIRRSDGDDGRDFLVEFYRQVHDVVGSEALVLAYSTAVKQALRQGVEWESINCYQLFIPSG